MKIINTLEDFIQLLKDESIEHVCLQNTTIDNNWIPEQFILYLNNLESHKKETGVRLYYDSLPDFKGRIEIVNFSIRFPNNKDNYDKCHKMTWKVK